MNNKIRIISEIKASGERLYFTVPQKIVNAYDLGRGYVARVSIKLLREAGDEMKSPGFHSFLKKVLHRMRKKPKVDPLEGGNHLGPVSRCGVRSSGSPETVQKRNQKE